MAGVMFDQLVISLTNIWAYVWYCRVIWTYRQKVGAWPNPAWPNKLDEKFLWRKIFDRNPEFVMIYDRLMQSSAAVLHGDWTASLDTNKIGVGVSE